MRLRETYSSTERRNMLKGIPISFMKYIFDPLDAFYNNIFSVFNGYFMRSNNKRISPIYEAYLEDDDIDEPDITFLPYSISVGGDLIEDDSANVSPLLIAEDYGVLKVSSSLSEYSYTCRVFCYDIHGKSLGYVTYMGLVLSGIKDYRKGTYFVRFSVLNSRTEEPIPFSLLNRRRNGFTLEVTRNTPYNMEHLGTLIRNTFIDKWTRMYSALSATYNPIYSVNITETNSGADTENKNSSTNNETNNVISKTDTTTFEDRKDIDTLDFNDRRTQSDETKNITVNGTKGGNDSNTKNYINVSENSTKTYNDVKDDNTETFNNYTDKKTRTYSDYTETTTDDTITKIAEDRTVTDNGIENDYTFGFNSNSRVSVGQREYGDNTSHIKADFGDTNKTVVDGDGTKTISGSYEDKDVKSGSIKNVNTKSGSETIDNLKNGTESSSNTYNITTSDTTDGSITVKKSEYGSEINTKEKLGKEKFTSEETDNVSSSKTTEDSITTEYGKSIEKVGTDRPVAENIQIELDLRDKNILINAIYADIDSIITLQIYA